MTARLFGLLLTVASITCLYFLGAMDNLMHISVFAYALMFIVSAAYGLMCAITGRFGP